MPSLSIPAWLVDKISPSIGSWTVAPELPTFAGISGGRTSGLMAVLLDEYCSPSAPLEFCFQNTGREAENTYRFLHNLGQCLSRPITWLEYLPPANLGDAPKFSRFQQVTFESADRSGKPFWDLLVALREYRKKEKGLGPVSPNPTQRLCTAYLKYKTQRKYILATGAEYWEHLVGIRADEVSRIAKLVERDTQIYTHRAPLAECGITKEDVNRFWSEQPFTLELPENLGNCTLCFLKDYADLAFNMYSELAPEEVEWWLAVEDEFGTMLNGGWTYHKLRDTAKVRLENIRPTLQSGREPENDGATDGRDFKLLVRQERRVLREGLVRLPCMCESAELIGMDD